MDSDATHSVPAQPLLSEVAGGWALSFRVQSPEKSGADENEDSVAVFGLGPSRCVLAVADGMGGQLAGGAASRLAVDALAASLDRAVDDAETGLRAFVLDAFERANADVSALGVGAGTTFAVAEIDGSVLRPYHVGDSAILVVGQRGRLKLHTVSHSPVGYALEAGLLDEQEALHHEERHVVSNAIGDPEMRIEVGAPLELARYDTVLLATDGLLDNLSVAEITDFIRKGPLEDVGASLIRAVRARMQDAESGAPSKPDDLGFVVFRRGA